MLVNSFLELAHSLILYKKLLYEAEQAVIEYGDNYYFWVRKNKNHSKMKWAGTRYAGAKEKVKMWKEEIWKIEAQLPDYILEEPLLIHFLDAEYIEQRNNLRRYYFKDE